MCVYIYILVYILYIYTFITYILNKCIYHVCIFACMICQIY